MFKSVFEGNTFAFYFDDETEEYLLLENRNNSHILLKGEDASLFQRLIETVDTNPAGNKFYKIERIISIFFYFRDSCPIPHFVET